MKNQLSPIMCAHNPTIHKCFKLVRKEKEKRGRGEETVSNHQAIINTSLYMAKEGKKIYVPSYSKEFIKDLCYAFQLNGRGDKIQDYTSDTAGNVKRWDMPTGKKQKRATYKVKEENKNKLASFKRECAEKVKNMTPRKGHLSASML